GALARIAPDHPNAVLLICGAGPLKDKLGQLARRKGVAEQVRFLGQVPNPYPLLANADACVMSSDYEGQPMALLEALCLGIPCIGTDIPGIRSVLKEGRGHIVAPTEEAFAEAMKAAIEGRLPQVDAADIGGEYAEATMDEFYRNVCGRPG
ncbi:MAG: glycosyltransferase, partial [Hyphomonas sp.]|nr:glycosyltransferase [Hyphomonas sp.]